jgi:hypothetical protein
MPTTNIDDLLTGTASPSVPETPEHKVEAFEDQYQAPDEETEEAPEKLEADEEEKEDEPEVKEELKTDEYGNKALKARTYTQEEADEYANRLIRERLARLERNQPNPSQQQMQQHVQENFKPDASSEENWQKQLKDFIKQTNVEVVKEQAQQAYQAQEAQSQEEFRQKFYRSMERLGDYDKVVSKHEENITEAMLLASRAFDDPAAFFYAAAKKAPAELERIAKMKDPYKQLVETGRLEERMKRTKTATNAPKPVSRTREDAPIAKKTEPKGQSIEDMMHAFRDKQAAKINQRRGKL